MAGKRPDEKRQAAYRRGLIAEQLVAWRYRLRGYRIIAQRFKSSRGEIDLVARKGRQLVFVEVKARQAFATDADPVPERSRRRIVAAAMIFAGRGSVDTAADWRFDITLVAPWAWPVIIENAFSAEL